MQTCTSLRDPKKSMPDSEEISAQMRDEWNSRAREDAGYYVAFGSRDQDDAAFFATATEVIVAAAALRNGAAGESQSSAA